jgi:HK97 family phage prohead protease
MEIKRSTSISPELQVKLATPEGTLEGYASTFHNVDALGEIVMPGAFTETLRPTKRRKIQMLWNHDPAEVIGVWDEIAQDAKGLRVKGRLAMGTRRGAEARELAKMGQLYLSIGFNTVRQSFDDDGHRLLHEIDLWEASIVAFPANPEAEIFSIKSRGQQMEHEILFLNFLRNSSVSHTALHAYQSKNITLGDMPGVAVPESIANELDRQVQAFNPFRVLHGPARQAMPARRPSERQPAGTLPQVRPCA